MAEMTIAGSIQNTRNSEADAQGYALPPIAANLKDGQIAINTSDSDPCIFFKSITGKIVKIPSEGVLVKALTDILGNSAADLDTLRELIAQFEGSANDILPMLTALTDRVTAAETSLTNKADKSTLNTTNTNLSNHTGSRSNPHNVTAAQVGALPLNGTAEDSKKLGGVLAANFWHAGNSNLPTIDWTCKNLQANRVYAADYYVNANRCITDNGSTIYFGGLDSTHTGVVAFRTKGVERVLIKNDGTFCVNGNAGFGTNNPTDRVHAIGNIRATENGYFGGSLSSRSLTVEHNLSGVNAGLILRNTSTSGSEYSIGSDIQFQGYQNGVAASIKARHNAYFGTSRLYLSCNGGIELSNNTTVSGDIKASGSGNFGGNVNADGSGIFKGDIVAKSTNAVTFSTSDAAAGATRLNDLIDVKIPTDISAKMVLNYDPTQVNSDGTTGGFTFSPAVGVGTGKVDAAVINSLPDHNHNDIIYTSDERLKENIVDLKDKATKMILSLSPKSFTWNDKARSFGLNDDISYGLIAQEVEKVMPELVKPLGKEDYIGVDYVKIVPILIGGVQEQHKEIISLNRKLDAIQSRANKAYGSETNNADEITKLKAEIEELKMLIKNR